MNNNSLREITKLDFSNRSFDSSLATLLLDSSRHNQILVEGDKDEQILKQFFDNNSRFVVTGSKNNVLKIVSRVFARRSNILGICDKDYEPSHLIRPHIFYYDCNNLEMMLVSNDSIFDKSVFRDAGFRKEQLANAKNTALTSLFPVSILRLLRSEKGMNFSLDDVVPSDDLLLLQPYETNVLCIKTNIFNRLTDLSIEERSLLICDYSTKLLEIADHLSITQGHDFVRIFRRMISGMSEDKFYNLMSAAYSDSLFNNTDLYKKIRMYETTELVTLLI